MSAGATGGLAARLAVYLALACLGSYLLRARAPAAPFWPPVLVLMAGMVLVGALRDVARRGRARPP